MKKITVRVRMSGYVDCDMEVDDDMIIDDDNIDLILDKYDFSQGNDISDTIEWKLRNANSIEVFDENYDRIWSDDDEDVESFFADCKS